MLAAPRSLAHVLHQECKTDPLFLEPLEKYSRERGNSPLHLLHFFRGFGTLLSKHKFSLAHQGASEPMFTMVPP